MSKTATSKQDNIKIPTILTINNCSEKIPMSIELFPKSKADLEEQLLRRNGFEKTMYYGNFAKAPLTDNIPLGIVALKNAN